MRVTAINILTDKRLLSGLIALIIIIGFTAFSHAATVIWSGGGSDNLASTSANWNMVPQSGDDIIFDNSLKDCTWDIVLTLSSLITNSEYSGIITVDEDLSITGDVNISGGTLILNNGNLLTGAAPPSLPPAVISEPASNINGNAAALNATVNPNGSETTVHFEWGTDTNYGNSTASQDIGSGTGTIAVSAGINRLSRNTVYHYRAVAVNAQGTSYGDDVVFTTLGGTPVGATTISSNTTWTYAGSPYIINGNISVYGASEPALTIEPGVEVRFNGLYYLNIGYSSYKGRLAADGTLSSPIVFTSNNASPTPGNWYGIRFYNHTASESRLNYVIIEYGGYQYGGLYLANSSAIIQNSSVRYSSTDGIYLSGDSNPVITNSIISNNNSEGVYVSGTSSSVSYITNTTFENNGSYALDMPVNAALGSGNIYINSSGIKLTGATISANTTWSYQTIPYIVSQSISVYGTSSEPVLTIEAGVVVKFTGPYYLSVGTSSYKGRLIAQGTSSSPITFTATTLTNGFWYGLRFYKHAAAESILDYVTVEYGGYGSGYGSIYVYDSSPIIQNSIVRHSKYDGVYIYGSTGFSAPTITNSIISDNESEGVFVSGANVSVSSITNTTFDNNGSYALDIPVTAALGSGNIYNNSSGIKLTGATISTDTVWSYQTVPYIISQSISLYGTSSEPVLTVEPGVVVKFTGPYYLSVGTSSYKGRLIAQGTSSTPITFTATTLTNGFWYGLRFYNHAVAESILDYVTVDYAGYNTTYDSVYLYNSSPVIRNSTIQNSKYDGLNILGDSSPVIAFSTISSNAANGINASGTGNVDISFSSISNNSQYAVYSTVSVLNVRHCNITGNGNGIYGAAGKVSDARFNWWGSAAGPGAFVNQYVNYEPWLGASYTYPFYNMDLSATLQQFNSPGSSVNYTFSISDNSTWDFHIKDSGGNTLKTFTGAGNSGNVTWDGKDGNGVIVPDGTYTYQLFSTSQTDSSQSAPLTGDVQVNNILPSAIIAYPANNQYLGNASLNIQGTANADYFNNYKVEYGPGADPAVWTLITSSTTPVNSSTLAVLNPSGLTGDFYTLRLSVNDNFTNTTTALVRVNLLNIHSLDISSLSFSPNGDGINDMTTITASMTYHSDWVMDIKDSGGNTVKSFNGSGTSLSVVWDGKDSGGVIQPEGVYSFIITATELISSTTAVVTGSIAIDFPDPPAVTTNPATGLTVDSATLNATVNPNGAETTVYFQWGTDTSYGNNTSTQSIGSGTSAVSAATNLTGLSRGVTYHYRAVASNISGTTFGNDMSFITAPQAPSDLTATVISSSQVNLSWIDNSSTENGFKIERKNGVGGTFEQIATVSANTTTYSDSGLTPETTYFYRVAAYNSIGNSYYSNEVSVSPTVLPIVATAPAIYISANTAILTGVINPHGVNTTYYFEWGTTASYGNTFSGVSTKNGTGDVTVTADLSGLLRGTIYHYRLVATNAYGTAYGSDMTFTTIAGTDVSGIISTDTTWTLAGSPYIITDSVLVYGTSNPTLTIEPGVVVRFMGYGLFIGTYNWGALKAQGMPSNPIVFTSNNPDPAPRDWMVIMFGGYSTSESILEHVIVEYGGWWEDTGWTSISVSGAEGNLRINNSTIRYSEGSGIELSGGSSLTLTDSNIVSNVGDGLYSHGWGSINITGSAISNNGGTGINDRSSDDVVITDSIISNNGEDGIYSDAYDDITIVNSTISSNGNYGVYATTVNTNISFSAIDNNAYGGVFSEADNLKINHCNITGNDYGVYSAAGKLADVRFNWWGDASGPSGEGYGTGQTVGSGINFEPWLGTPFLYPFYNVELTATVQKFSPLNNSAGYSFSISENADWLFSLNDSSGNTIKSFSGFGTSGSVAWDGTDSGGAQAPDGTYYYSLDSTRPGDGARAASFIGDVVVGAGIPKAEISYPLAGQFISGSFLLNIQGTATDSDFKDYKVEYGVGTSPQTWTLIANSAAQINSGTLATWNSSSLTSAYYTIRLSVSDLTENTATDIVEVKLFNIYNVAISVPSFSPNGDGYKDATSIGAYLTYPADWIIDIRNSAGAIVRTFSGTGTYSYVVWDGRDASGNIQPAGEYSCTITATEPVSGTTAAVTGNITINLSLPAVITDPATNVADSSALLNATANPNDSPASVYFQWGTDISYGNNTSQQSAGSGTDNVSISINLTGLSTGIIYHYRAAAVSANGTSYGEDRVFKPNSTTLTGVVTDASTGSAVSYVKVTVTDLFGTYSTLTNSSGVYTLAEVVQGDFTVIFEKAGYIPYEASGTLNFNQTLTLNVQLTPVSPIFIDIASPADGVTVSTTPVTVTGSVYNAAGIGGNLESLAQSFKPTISGSLNKVSLLLSKIGSPSDNIYVRISGEFMNYPFQPIAVSSTRFSDGYWITFTFPDPPAVTAGETYFVELYREARDTNNYYVWNNIWNIYLDYYTDGTVFRRNNGVWDTYCSCDFAFRVYINNNIDASQEAANELKNLYGTAPYPMDVTVNGIQASVSSNTFSASVPLTEGPITITAEASDQYNHTASDAVNIIFSPLPEISDITVTNITTDSAVITWTTDQQSDSLVEYGTTTAYESSVSDLSMTTSHSITLTGLSQATEYHFKITSTNTNGALSSSGDNTFTSAALPPPPVISNITVGNITNNSAVITWTTDQQADSVIDYGVFLITSCTKKM